MGKKNLFITLLGVVFLVPTFLFADGEAPKKNLKKINHAENALAAKKKSKSGNIANKPQQIEDPLAMGIVYNKGHTACADTNWDAYQCDEKFFKKNGSKLTFWGEIWICQGQCLTWLAHQE
ncbi:MAG: hypothetical protein HQK54_04120 [Oligoflexales bacterium]|nr:hypothetical protein [Oligoflexales bacterium]